MKREEGCKRCIDLMKDFQIFDLSPEILHLNEK